MREVIRHGENGLLADFFSPQQMAVAVDEAFEHPGRMQELRVAARQTIVERYDVHHALRHYLAMIEKLCEAPVIERRA